VIIPFSLIIPSILIWL